MRLVELSKVIHTFRSLKLRVGWMAFPRIYKIQVRSAPTARQVLVSFDLPRVLLLAVKT